MATVKELTDKLTPVVKGYKSFKIGKTGQTLKERFDQEHSKNYKHSAEVCYSSMAGDIDRYEEQIIACFKNYPNNDNDQKGGGEMTKSNSGRYIVYIVWN